MSSCLLDTSFMHLTNLSCLDSDEDLPSCFCNNSFVCSLPNPNSNDTWSRSFLFSTLSCRIDCCRVVVRTFFRWRLRFAFSRFRFLSHTIYNKQTMCQSSPSLSDYIPYPSLCLTKDSHMWRTVALSFRPHFGLVYHCTSQLKPMIVKKTIFRNSHCPQECYLRDVSFDMEGLYRRFFLMGKD